MVYYLNLPYPDIDLLISMIIIITGLHFRSLFDFYFSDRMFAKDSRGANPLLAQAYLAGERAVGSLSYISQQPDSAN